MVPRVAEIIVEGLNQLVTNTIWSISDAKSNETEKLHNKLRIQVSNLKSLIQVPRLPLGHRMHRCAERRNKILIQCLIAAAQAVGKPGYLADCDMALGVLASVLGVFVWSEGMKMMRLQLKWINRRESFGNRVVHAASTMMWTG